MKPNRKYVTPFIALIFVIVAISGICMFFHVFDGYTEVLHELLGISFVGFAVMHVIVNWSSLKNHFGRGVFVPAAISVLVIAAAIIALEQKSPPVDIVLIGKLVRAPIRDAFKVLNMDYAAASAALQANGMAIGEAKTLEEVWINNDASPEDVINILVRK